MKKRPAKAPRPVRAKPVGWVGHLDGRIVFGICTDHGEPTAACVYQRRRDAAERWVDPIPVYTALPAGTPDAAAEVRRSLRALLKAAEAVYAPRKHVIGTHYDECAKTHPYCALGDAIRSAKAALSPGRGRKR